MWRWGGGGDGVGGGAYSLRVIGCIIPLCASRLWLRMNLRVLLAQRPPTRNCWSVLPNSLLVRDVAWWRSPSDLGSDAEPGIACSGLGLGALCTISLTRSTELLQGRLPARLSVLSGSQLAAKPEATAAAAMSTLTKRDLLEGVARLVPDLARE